MTERKKKFLIIFTLGLLSAIGPLSIDMYLPGFQAMAESLNTTVAHIGLSLSSFFVGISIGQLIYGPVIDRYGRIIPLYVGLILYLLMSVLSVFVASADMLIIYRFFQALGSCAGMVVARALIRDLFPVEENAKVFSLIMLVIAVSPIAAPTAGGYITAAFGWQAIFITLAIISFLILLAVYFWLPAGQKPDPSVSLKPKAIGKNFVSVSKVPKFFTYAGVSAIASSGLYAYISGAPHVIMGLYDVSPKDFGLIMGAAAIGMVIANVSNTFLLRKFSSEKITFITLAIQMVLGFILALTTITGQLNLYLFVGLISLYLCMQGFIFPNTSALAMAPFEKGAGTASALMGAVQMGIGALAIALVSILHTGSALPMTGVMFLCASSAFGILVTGRSVIKKNTQGEVKEPTAAYQEA